MTSTSKDGRVKYHTYRMWKGGQIVSSKFEGSATFHSPTIYPRMSRERIFAVDTESLSVGGRLSTVLIPLKFDNWGTLLETPEGIGMLEVFFHTVVDRFGVKYERESRIAQRPTRASTGSGSGRNGRRMTVDPTLAVFFNLPYDFGRMSADRRDILKAVSAGPESVKFRISDRLELEVVRMHFGSGSSFEWFIRRDGDDPEARRIVRLIGLDLAAYWKTSLGEAAKSVGVLEKLDLDPALFQKPREAFTAEEWSEFRRYALGDPATTLELYHATVDLLVEIDVRVIRRTGVIPASAPGASARIVFAQVFDRPKHVDEDGVVYDAKPGCHPGLKSWERYSSAADQMGLDAYYGGRSFNTERAIRRRMGVFDLKSAYPYALCCLPDPVTVSARPVLSSRERVGIRDAKGKPATVSAVAFHEAREAAEWDNQTPVVIDGTFDLEQWKGRFGVLYIDGESLDDIYPAFRIHSPRKRDSGRLRYVAGRFENRPVTIPEICVGVASGRLRVDRVRRGVVLDGEPTQSFLRAGILEFFAIKEDPSRPKPLRDMAKLLAVSLYGKLIETQATDYGIASVFPMARFAKSRSVRDSITRINAEQGADDNLDALYWGETRSQQGIARDYYQRCLEKLGTDEDRGTLAIVDYVTALRRADVTLERKLDGTFDEAPISIADYVGKSHRCGFYFFPLYAANVTGLVSAMLGQMAADIGAKQGDTDAVHFEVPEDVKMRDADQLPGFDRYFETMKAAGYPSPRRLANGRYVDAIPGGERLGVWELETPEPSIESVLVRPKVYSHLFADGTVKQARHGFARFGATGPDLAGAWFDQMDRFLREFHAGAMLEARAAHRALERFEKAIHSPDLVASEDASSESRALAFHEALRSLVTTGRVMYQGRASPRKIKEALVSGREVGVFNSRVFESMLAEDPNTYRDDQGRTRWKQTAGAVPHKPMARPVRPVFQKTKRRTA